MIQEDKELLLKDLCARLPHGVKVHIKGEYNKSHQIEEIDVRDGFVRYFENMHLCEERIYDCKPYLRPMSSMTEDESHEYNMHLLGITIGVDAMNFMIWIYQHHLDILKFIDKGLALEAPEGMYK